MKLPEVRGASYRFERSENSGVIIHAGWFTRMVYPGIGTGEASIVLELLSVVSIDDAIYIEFMDRIIQNWVELWISFICFFF